ncbi:hypothetical protein B0T16DRAFT_457141 [Cercophora newfieldiana]|uniref:Uncharacterized protein n=1 Tax=Cercophora newfieldiana TaxID=92897 RepID=A0AA40CSL9_9PEZI|nr:hypothetical protein B0T16DRAFT_457141 [Cercophora newfieldiana]
MDLVECLEADQKLGLSRLELDDDVVRRDVGFPVEPCCLLTAALLTLLFLAGGTTHRLTHWHQIIHPLSDSDADFMNDYGNSSATAIARGRVPPVFTDRLWFKDRNMTERLSVEELMAGKYSSIWTRRFHTEHCLFMWRKLTMVVKERYEWVDNKTVSYWHAKHCVGVFLGRMRGGSR